MISSEPTMLCARDAFKISNNRTDGALLQIKEYVLRTANNGKFETNFFVDTRYLDNVVHELKRWGYDVAVGTEGVGDFHGTTRIDIYWG